MAFSGRVATVSLLPIPNQVGRKGTEACPPIGVSMVLDHGLRFCCRAMEDTVTMLKEIKESGLSWGYTLTLDSPKHWFPGESILHIDEDADCFKLKFTVITAPLTFMFPDFLFSFLTFIFVFIFSVESIGSPRWCYFEDL